MRTIGQRELRNDNAAVIRAVEDGETLLVTKNGKPVAVLRPATATEQMPGLPLGTPARRRPTYADLPRVQSRITSEEILSDLRDER
jgi:prevent-host-death family protein